ncbi:hypothetical protein GQQ18_20705 (plasmid) [Pantoea agglomerans]|uniref:hypothetical protein n=1 Tax=Enterobacter agglomerans TaxID=549 RepID=UPI0013D41BAC|nr:hypothetical protein [Pantoea agglomerans]NEG69002.1 hypothetical protein [Pantoea agglomerans]
MDFKMARLNAYHKWPQRTEFKAEQKFDSCLEKNDNKVPLEVAILGKPSNNNQSIYIGHYLDGLEALPRRPDYMFDHCFRVIDSASKIRYAKKGLKGIAQGLGKELVKADPAHWKVITDSLCHNLPAPTLMYIVKRMCESYIPQNDTSKQFNGRVIECTGGKFYDEFIKKFSIDENKNITPTPSGKLLQSASSFMRLYLSGAVGTKKRKNVAQALDLTNPNNVPSDAKRIEFLMSIWLFTMRNERAHGSALSPFKTSKSSLERYESYYFAMLACYIFSLGALSISAPNMIKVSEIELCSLSNTASQNIFFMRS